MRTLIGALGLTCTALFLSCFDSATVTCGKDGPVCPAGWACVTELSACINPLDTLCGNGVKDEAANEQCDDGNFKNDDDCNWDCKLPRCGDGFKRGDEVCDKGDTEDGGGCSADCLSEEICGDSYKNPGEACDQGLEDTVACDGPAAGIVVGDCTAAQCGDGRTNLAAGELCDKGNPGSPGRVEDSTCNDDCTTAVCGDGKKNATAGEQCDSGSFCVDGKTCTTAADCVGIGDATCAPRDSDCCTAKCQNPNCGNGITEETCTDPGGVINTNEACDDGKQCQGNENGNSCQFDIECAELGDGKCTTRNGGTCSADCLSRQECGDGIRNDYPPFNEVCDTGSECTDGTDCTNDETVCATIGDGTCAPRDGPRPDGEQCSANCLSREVCGDGITNNYQPYNEVCDNGAQCTDGKACKSSNDCVGITDGSCLPRNGDKCSATCDSTEICGDNVTSNYPTTRTNAHPRFVAIDAPYIAAGTSSRENEACDDGNTIDADGCSSECLSAERCGDGYLNNYAHKEFPGGPTLPAEVCDDRNNNNGDGCSANCLSLEACGNGTTDPGEECDDNNEENGDDCSFPDCRAQRCGDGKITPPELCDDGDALNSFTGNCLPTCQRNICGDRLVNRTLNEAGEPIEECDSAAQDSAICNRDCTLVRCGDELINFAAGERCDGKLGVVEGETEETTECNVDCTIARCGDGAANLADGSPGLPERVNSTRGELCDDGNQDNGDGCSSDCRSTEVCGDKVVNAAAPKLEVCDNGSACDDGSACLTIADCSTGFCLPRDGDNCSEDCKSIEICGDSYLNNYPPKNESCDDGNTASSDGCAGTTCTIETGWSCPTLGRPCLENCKDGLVVGLESCDEGTATASGGCNASCKVLEGWSCPTTGGVGGLCKPICNDRLVRGIETCDDGNLLATDGCSATCQQLLGWVCPKVGGIGGTCISTCGDAKVVGTEECDDGGQVAGDGCDAGCRQESGWTCPTATGLGGACTPNCGDGLVRGVETCDEGTSVASGGCQSCVKLSGWTCSAGSTCTTTCGDGIQVGAEQCDSGTSNSNTGLCTLECETATCADGLRLAAGAAAETDVDCGGSSSCARCANNLRCVNDSDCLGNYCNPGSFCATPLLNADTWTFNVASLDGAKKKTVPVLNLLANDGSNGDIAANAVFTIKTQPTCGTVAEAGGIVTFTDGRPADPLAQPPVAAIITCPWGQTFTYEVCSPTSADAQFCATAIVTVNVNHAPTLSFPDICLPLTTLSTTVNVSSTAVFLDPDGNPWGSFPTAPAFLSYVASPPELPAKTATVTTTGPSITLTPDGGPAGGTYTVNVSACDNVVGVNVTDPAEHEACTATTPWVVKWQASLDLREFNDALPNPVLHDASLAFPLGEVTPNATTNSVVVGPAPGSAAVLVSKFANGPFKASDATTLGTCSYVGDTNLVLNGDERKITYAASATPGNDACYVQVCEPCGTLNLCNVMRIPLRVINSVIANSDTVNATEQQALPSTGTFAKNTLMANDLYNSAASFTLVGTPFGGGVATSCTGGKVVVSGPDVVYTGAASPAGPCLLTDTFQYEVCSPEIATECAIATVTIKINRLPVAAADAVTVVEDSPLSITTASLLSNDSDPNNLAVPGTDTLTISAVSGATHGTVLLSDTTIVFTPTPADYNGPASFTYTLSDGKTGTATATVTVTVTSVVDIASDLLVGTEDVPLVFNPVAGTAGASIDTFENEAPQITQINGSNISVGTPVAVTNGSVGLAAGNVLTFTPTADFNGAVPQFTYTVASGGVTEQANINITLAAVADILNDTPAAANEDVAQVVSVLTNDTFENSGKLVTAVTQPAHGVVTITGAGTTTTYTPTGDYNGTDSYTYTVTSGGVTETAAVNVVVNAVADVVNDSPTGTEDTAAVVSVLGNDSFANPGKLVTAVTQGAHGVVTITGAGSTTTYTPAADYNGPDSYTYTVTSGGVAETATVNIAIAAVPDIAADPGQTTAEDTAKVTSVLANDTFEDTAGRIITAKTNGASGTVTITDSGTTTTYTPNADFNGTDSYTYTVTSGGVTETATVSITVSPVVDIAADTVTTFEDLVLVSNLLTNDTFASPARTITAVSTPTKGTAVISNGGATVTYTPTADYNGSDSYTYTVTSGGVTETATVTVTVTAVADIVADSVTLAEDSPTTTNLLTNDSFEGTPSISAKTNGAHGTVSIVNATTGTVSYSPDADFNGVDSYTYTVTSPAGVSETATVSVTITAAADSVNDTASGAEDVVGGIIKNVFTNDNYSGTKSVTSKTDGANGTVAITNAATGVLTYTPNADFNGSDSFTYTTTAAGLTEVATVTVTVTPVVDIVPDFVAVDEDLALTFDPVTNVPNAGAEADTFKSAAAQITRINASTITVGGGAIPVTNGTVSLAVNNDLTFTPSANFSGLAGFTYTVTSGGVTETADISITVNPLPDGPEIVAGNTSSYTENQVSPVALEPFLTANDVDDTNMASGSVTISAGTFTAGDTLAFADQLGITESYNSGTGVLTLTGVAPLATYVALFTSVTFATSSDAPTANGTSRTITWSLTDANSTGAGAATGTATSTITVTAVNDAPAGTNTAKTILEEATYTFAAADFGFTDPSDIPASTLAGVKFTTLPPAGEGLIKLSGTSIAVGDEITAANIGNVTFVPVMNVTGATKGAFTFQVRDNGGTANSGVDLDQSANTFSFTITNVNDAPTGTNTTKTILEEATYTFAAADFGFGDALDTTPNTLAAVKFTTLPPPGEGVIKLSGTNIALGDEVVTASIPNLTFVPIANLVGATKGAFTFQVRDNGGTANSGVDLDQSANTFSFTITNVNDAPAGADNTKTIFEEATYTFAAGDFALTDVNDSPADTLASVKFTTLPPAGEGFIKLSGTNIAVGDEIAVANIGNVTFAPVANVTGATKGAFTFQVRDNGGTANSGVDLDPSANAFSFTITNVNDAPTGTDTTKTFLEGTASYTFGVADFGFGDANDSPTNTFTGVKFTTLPPVGEGAIKLSGTNITVADEITVADIPNLTFVPVLDVAGAAKGAFTFQVRDNGGTANSGVDLDATANSFSFTITNVNDAPDGTNVTKTMLEEATFTFAASDFGFTDGNDSPSNALASVKFTTLPPVGEGAIKLSGTNIAVGDEISLASIPNVTFVPVVNVTGSIKGAFTFQVRDNGGVANSGVDLDSTANTFDFTINNVNDAPTGTDATKTILEEATHTFAAADFGFSDPLDATPNTLQAVKFTTLPPSGEGFIKLSGTDIAVGDEIGLANIPNLTFVPVANVAGSIKGAFTFQVRDNGGIANSGVDLDQTANTFHFTITNVNDAPSGTDKHSASVTTTTTYTFAAGDFGFADASDSPANNFLSVVITTLPPALEGVLYLGVAPVVAGDPILVGDVPTLVFDPGTVTGNPKGAFTFQVRDDGGTANSGVDTDATPNNFSFDISL